MIMANAGARLAPYAFILLWSSSFVTARVGLALISPLLFVAVRLVAAAALLGLVLAVRRQSLAPLRKRWHHLALAGVLVKGITLSAFHVGMVTENVAVMVLMQTLSPMLIAVSAVPLLGERLGPRQWLGLTLGATVVRDGPFRFSRNPIYLSLTVLYLGVIVLINTLWGFVLVAPLFGVVQHGVIKPEERYLEQKFGEEYLRYKARVRCWI